MKRIKKGVYAIMKDGSLVSAQDFRSENKENVEHILVKWGVSEFRMQLEDCASGVNWYDAQKSAKKQGKEWRCPTRHEAIDLYDVRFNGLDELLGKLGVKPMDDGWMWTQDEDADPQCSAGRAWGVYLDYGLVGGNTKSYAYSVYRVRAVSDYQPES